MNYKIEYLVVSKKYKGYKDLKVFQLSYRLALEIFQITKGFPKEELYSLTDQIRRSSRSVSANISEAWRKRKYPKYFVSKLIDCLAEESETVVWLHFSYDEIARMLNSMIENPEKFCH